MRAIQLYFLLLVILQIFLSACQEFERLNLLGESIVSNIKSDSALVSSSFADLASNEAIIQYGHCWSTSSNPTTTDSVTRLGSTNQKLTFKSQLIKLNPETVYYVRPYAITAKGTFYGNEISFNTLVSDGKWRMIDYQCNCYMAVGMGSDGANRAYFYEGKTLGFQPFYSLQFGSFSLNDNVIALQKYGNLPPDRASQATGIVGFIIGTNAYIGLGYKVIAGGFGFENGLQYSWFIEGASNQDVWKFDGNEVTRVADYPGKGKIANVAFGLNGKGYVGLGRDSLNWYKDFWEYDPVANVWTKKADFPGEARAFAVAVVLNGKGYMGTGSNGSRYLNDFWEYDAQSDAWTRKADFTGPAREGAVAFALNNRVYIGLGGGKDLNSFRQTTDTNYIAPLVYPIYSTNFWQYDRKLSQEEINSFKKDFWQYNPLKNEWKRLKDFPNQARTRCGFFTLKGKGYIFGGVINKNSTGELWEFSP